MFRLLTVLISVWMATIPFAYAGDREQLLRHVDSRAERYAALAQRIWRLAEVGYQERESSAALQGLLREAGFRIEAPVAGMPTAFVASYGAGQPVVAMLAEYDALPGITQAAVAERRPVEARAGHACGHHLFGTASVAAAIAVRDWLEDNGRPGTVRVYGTPAEEGGSGKVYLVREGEFDDVDVALHWHPADRNAANPVTTLANKSAKFRFRGVSSHAAAAPERGRSALDGVEAMNFMVNLMREHVPESTRIHYVITEGGAAPNVVPNGAEVYYYIRHPDAVAVQQVFERVVAASEGAARGTGTSVEHEVIHGNHSLLPNETLARALHKNLTAVGGVVYDADDRRFAEALRDTLPERSPAIANAARVQAFEPGGMQRGSTDVGDVSWHVPTEGFEAATWVPGTTAHSWQAIAAGGTDIGNKGMIVAAKTLALTAVDLITDADLLNRARAEFIRRRGADFQYEPLVGDRQPPLDYRD